MTHPKITDNLLNLCNFALPPNLIQLLFRGWKNYGKMKKTYPASLFIGILLAGCAGAPTTKQTIVVDDSHPKAEAGGNVTILKQTAQGFEFRAEGVGVSTKYERPIYAEKRAEEDALNQVDKKSGINIYSSFQDVMTQTGKKDYQFVGRYLNIWTDNLVEYEKTAPASCNLDGELYRCKVQISGKVHFKGEPDPNFELQATLGKPAYFEGDSVSMNVRLTKDAYITVFNCDENGNITLLFPNPQSRDNFLKAGKELTLPDERQFQLKAMLPADRSETGEILHVIATKSQPLVLLDALKKEKNYGFVAYSMGGVKDLVAKLAKFDRSDWTTQVIVYEIKKK